jgi:hypothetical protein
VFANKVLGWIFETNKKAVRKNGKNYILMKLILFFLPHILKTKKSRNMGWAGHLVCMK